MRGEGATTVDEFPSGYVGGIGKTDCLAYRSDIHVDIQAVAVRKQRK